MSEQDKYRLIFERWKASLRDRNRSTEHVVSNFDDLFDDLAKAGATFDDAHAILPIAIKAHQPDQGLIRQLWKMKKSNPRFDISEKEFGQNWCNDIADMATNSFYNSFPMPNQSPSTNIPTDKIDEKEYKLMRRHADQFRQLDLNTLPDPSEDLMTDEEEIWKWLKERIKQ